MSKEQKDEFEPPFISFASYSQPSHVFRFYHPWFMSLFIANEIHMNIVHFNIILLMILDFTILGKCPLYIVLHKKRANTYVSKWLKQKEMRKTLTQ